MSIHSTPLYEGIPAGPALIKITSDETDNVYCVLEFWLPPGTGAPNHVHHREDEIMTVIQGTLTVSSNGVDMLAAEAGSVVRLPKGVPHAFRNAHDVPARMLVMAVPGGLDRNFAEIAALGQNATAAQVAEVNARFGVEFVE